MHDWEAAMYMEGAGDEGVHGGLVKRVTCMLSTKVIFLC